MGTYGIDYYGSVYYGSNSRVSFNATNFIAKPYDYSSIQLTWNEPSGSWDYLRLIRSQYGFPVTPDDGDFLFEFYKGITPSFYLDTGQVPNNSGLKPAQPYYYSIFVRDTSTNLWNKAGNAIGISVKDYNTTQTMYEYLPTILSSNIPYDTYLETNNTFLKKFLKLFAFQLDLYKSQAENITNRYDVDNVNGLLIPAFMEEFGLKYEPNLGIKQSRIFLRNVAVLNQTKGSKKGVYDFIKAYAGYDNTIVMGKNLMLDFNDSSFEQSIGSWAPISNCTLLRYPKTSSPTIAPYNEAASQSDFPNVQNAILKITSTASANVILSLSGDNPIHYGIPVIAGKQYTFSGYSKANSTIRAVSAQIYWYDRNGNALTPSTSGSTTNNSTSTWTRFTSSVTSPSNAFFAVPRIKIASTVSGEIHYLDALQFEQSSFATFFQDARQLKITLIANRINELINPNFELNTSGWAFTNGTAALSANEVGVDPDAPTITVSGGSVEIYPNAAGLVTVKSTSVNVSANNDYTFSIYVYDNANKYPVTAFISWYDSSNTLIYTETGTNNVSESNWSRQFITKTSPATAVTAKVGVTWTATAALDPIYLDAALFEKSSFINSYFDGNKGVAELADLFWEGTPNASRSHYYKNRFSVQSRLIKNLPNWLNYGTTFELFLAQPNM